MSAASRSQALRSYVADYTSRHPEDVFTLDGADTIGEDDFRICALARVRSAGTRPPRAKAAWPLATCSSDAVPAAMVAAFAAAPDDQIGDRFLAALEAGERAGGEEGAVHSCGMLVVDAVSWPVTDLRVDWADDPIAELDRIWAVWRPQADDYVTRALDPETAPSYGVPGDE